MSNMSYCRFQNTLGDLEDCFEHFEIEGEDDLSMEEAQAREDMIELCRKIVELYD